MFDNRTHIVWMFVLDSLFYCIGSVFLSAYKWLHLGGPEMKFGKLNALVCNLKLQTALGNNHIQMPLCQVLKVSRDP